MRTTNLAGKFGKIADDDPAPRSYRVGKESQPAKGTTFGCRAPLSLAIHAPGGGAKALT